MKIVVTQSNIDNGVIGECNKCPIALAILEQGYDSVKVQFGDIRMIKQRVLTGYVSSLAVRNFMHDFDAGREVRPQVFELNERII